MQVLTTSEWRQQREACLARLRPLVEAHLDRASRHEKHPVIDFLFQYYSFRPSQIMTWSPGIGVVLEDEGVHEKADGGRQALAAACPAWMVQSPDGWMVDLSAFPEKRIRGLDWVIHLLESIDGKVPRFGCHGLHEWAMVYKASDEQIRHNGCPLRLPMSDIQAVVEAQPVQCTHYDAFRFFMPDAKPLNRFEPTNDTRFELEQSACIHVNMDNYKWAYKYFPWISSDRLADALELAVDARWVDMQASPYDIRHLGREPICVETLEGRNEYLKEQTRLQAAGRVIRTALLQDLKELQMAVQVPV